MTVKVEAPVLQRCPGCGNADQELWREKGQLEGTARCSNCWYYTLSREHLQGITKDQADRLLEVKMVKPKLVVTCPEHGEFTSPEVDFLDVCSDIMGRDLVTFFCTQCDRNRQSLVRARSHEEEDTNE